MRHHRLELLDEGLGAGELAGEIAHQHHLEAARHQGPVLALDRSRVLAQLCERLLGERRPAWPAGTHMNAGRIAAGTLPQPPVDLGLCALAVLRSRKRPGSLVAAPLEACAAGVLRGGTLLVHLYAPLMLPGQTGRLVL